MRAEADVEAGGSSEAEAMFKEAYEAEAERSKLLATQVEQVLREKLGGSSVNYTVEAPEVATPLTDPSMSWRNAYEAVKKQAESFEEQLKKAKGVGAAPAEPAAATTTVPVAVDAEVLLEDDNQGKIEEPFTSAAGDAAQSGSTSPPPSQPAGDDGERRQGLFGMMGGSGLSEEELQRLRDLSDVAGDGDALVRLIATGLLERREATNRLLPFERASMIVKNSGLSFSDTYVFPRSYVFYGSTPMNAEDFLRNAGNALRQESASDSAPEIFLVEGQDEGRAMTVVLLESDLTDLEISWWQPVASWVLFIVSVLAAAATSFSVVTTTAQAAMDPNAPETASFVLDKVVPTAAGVVATCFASELGRRTVAQSYGITLSPPYYMPGWPLVSIGILGVAHRRTSLAPSKESETAMSIAASVAGYAMSGLIIALGLLLGPEADGVVNLNYQALPLFIKALLKPFLGAPSMTTDQIDKFADPVAISFPANPVLIGGVCGLILISLSLLPWGRLDGGVLFRNAGGSRASFPFAILTIVLLTLGAWGPGDGYSLYLSYAAFALIIQSGSELPPRDGVTDVDGNSRVISFLLVLLGFCLSLPGWTFPI